MKITVLGSGTSTGIPVPGCNCSVCCSQDKKNKRLRTSILIELEANDVNGGNNQAIAVLVDTSPDLRYQALRESITRIDAVLYTHTHADHVYGIDDLRGFNFINGSSIPLYASCSSCVELYQRFRYCFEDDPAYEGGAPPKLKLVEIEPYKPIEISGFSLIPLILLHGSSEVLGFRVNGFAYLTDCSSLPEETRRRLCGLDCLIIDGLRYSPHRTHFSHEEAVREVERLAPKKAYLTHISHEVEHWTGNEYLKKITAVDMECAYDGLKIIL